MEPEDGVFEVRHKIYKAVTTVCMSRFMKNDRFLIGKIPIQKLARQQNRVAENAKTHWSLAEFAMDPELASRRCESGNQLLQL